MAARAPIEALLWVVFLAAANLLAIPILPKVDVDAGLGAPVIVASATLLSPPFAALVNVVGFTNEREFKRGTSPWAIAFNRTQNGLAAAAASWAALRQPYGLIAGTIVAAVVYNVLNTLAVGFFVYLRGRAGLGRAARAVSNPFPRFFVDYGLVALLAIAIVLLYEQVGQWGVLLLAVPMYLGYSALRSARVAEDRAEELAGQVAELETLNRLGTGLLGVRGVDQVADTGAAALRTLLESDAVEVSPSGTVSDSLDVVKIPGSEPAAIGVPPGLSERPVVEAAARLLGMALQRLDLEAELAEGQRARVALSGRILEEGTRERSRIALEIHDDVLPFLAAAEIQADNVRSALAGGDAPRADRIASLTREAVHGGMGRLREVLDALRRQIIVPGGLRQGLVEALDELRLTTGVDSVLDVADPLPEVPLAVEIVVLELVRGCLTNVSRHARAKRVEVAVRVEGGVVSVTVTDDGCGFDPEAVPPGHHGLALMAQRIELARGRFHVESARGEGTRVEVEVPL